MMRWWALVWLLCGTINFGFVYAAVQAEYPYTTCDDQRWERENLAFATMNIAEGPIGLALSLFMTGFWQDGWTIRNQCKARRRADALRSEEISALSKIMIDCRVQKAALLLCVGASMKKCEPR